MTTVLGGLRHYGRMLLSAVGLVFTVVLLMFILLQMAPGDPIQALVGDMPVPQEYREQLTRQYGLDKPLYLQFLYYVGNVATGDLGYSYANGEPVSRLILARLGNTLLITVPALVLSSVIGIVLGAIAARTRMRWLDNLISVGSLFIFSIPGFWLGLMLILVFAVMLEWLPAQGMTSFTSSGLSLRHMILPVVALTAGQIAFKARVMRSSTIEALGQDYIDTARAKGLSSQQVLWRHALKNAMLPIIGVIGYGAGFTLAGSVFVESVFAWPGMGLLLYDSIQRREMMVVMGIVLVVAVSVVIINLLTDVVYGLVDPRVRVKLRQGRGLE